MKEVIAKRTRVVDASGIRKVFALAADLEDPVDFSIGQPDFDVPEPIKEAAIKAIRDGHNSYSQTAGLEPLRARLAEQLRGELGWARPSVMVTSGVSGALLLAFMALVDPGDEVIIPDPYFVMYKHLVNLLGGRCVFVDSYPDFRLPVEAIAAAVTDRTKLIIVNSPANPTGAVHGAEETAALARLASQRRIVVLSDEIYRDFCYDGPCTSVAAGYERTIVLRGFSKSYGMPGWRLGYAAVSESLQEVLEQMIKLQQYTFVCAPTPFQQAVLEAGDCDVAELVDAYRHKRDLLYEGLCDRFELVKPAGAFYAFVEAPGGAAARFVEKAIANNVLMIPGGVFSERDSHFRISYATSDQKIRQGIEILRDLA